MASVKTCLACNQSSPAEASFCGGCGLQLDREVCPACRAKLVPGNAFCIHCGHRVKEEAKAAANQTWSEERKLATIIFGDIVGFTKASGRLEADDVWELANEVLEPLSLVVRGHGGTVVKYIGDCIMAVFGVPSAGEDDPRRAVRAALAMRERVAELSSTFEARYGLPLSMRIGVHTGEVMVGRVASEGSGAPDVMGAAVNLASRVETLCRPKEVLISHATFRLVEEAFDCESLGPLVLKGVDEPVEVHRVLREFPEGSGLRVRATRSSIFLRQAELRALIRGYERMNDNGDAVLMRLTAESGLGKNRLVEEFRARVASMDPAPEILIAKGTVGATANAAPLQLVGRLIRQRFGVRADEALEEARARVMEAIRGAWPEGEASEAHAAAQILADLAQLTEDHLEGDPSPDPRSSGKDRLFVAFVSWLERLAARAPVCMLLGELQWTDDASLDFLERLLGSVQQLPVFILLGHQPLLEERRPSWPSTDVSMERIDLAPLSTAQIKRMVDDALSSVPDLPETMKEDLVARAEGNPEYATELIRLLIDRGAITLGTDREPGRWNPERLGELVLPDTILGVLQARLDGLPPEEKDLLKRASVIGRSFWRRALLSSFDETGELDTLLDSLVRREIVRPYEGTPLEGEEAFRFRAQAFRDVAYRSIPRSVREEWHRRAAEWLEQHTALWEGGHAELAGHLDAAGLSQKARGHYLRAARHALSVHDNRNATVFYAKSLGVWPQDTDHEGRASARRELSAGYARLGRFEEALESLTRAAGDLRAAGLEPDDAVFARLDLERARLLKERGHVDASLESIDRGLARVEGHPPDLLQVWLHGQRALLLSLRGEMDSAGVFCRKGIEIAERMGFRERLWEEAMAMLLNVMGAIHLRSQEIDAAERCFMKAVDLVGASDPRFRMTALVNLGALAFDRSDLEVATRHFSDALNLSRRLNWARYKALCQSNLGQTLLAAGRLEEAMEELESARRLGEQGGFLDVVADSALALADGWLRSGDADRGLASALDAIGYTERAGQTQIESQAHVLAMECLLAGARPVDDSSSPRDCAHRHLRAACDILAASNRPNRQREIDDLLERFEAKARALQGEPL